MPLNIQHLNPIHADDRGEIWDVLDGKSIGHVGVISSNSGAVRGNHYHKNISQYTYVLRGQVEWLNKDKPEDPNSPTEKVVLNPGDLVFTPPGTAHATRSIDKSELLELRDKSPEECDFQKDTVRCVLIRSSWPPNHN